MWGSAAQADKENAPAQVISLVGMSAESLRAAACSRGVRAGVEIQVVGHQCLEKWNGEYASRAPAPDGLWSRRRQLQARFLKVSFLEFNFTFLIQIKACSHHCEHRWTLFDANIKDPST